MENIKKLDYCYKLKADCCFHNHYSAKHVGDFCRDLAAGIESGKLSSKEVVEILRGVEK
mgnify:CR=1 FL=1